MWQPLNACSASGPRVKPVDWLCRGPQHCAASLRGPAAERCDLQRLRQHVHRRGPVSGHLPGLGPHPPPSPGAPGQVPPQQPRKVRSWASTLWRMTDQADMTGALHDLCPVCACSQLEQQILCPSITHTKHLCNVGARDSRPALLAEHIEHATGMAEGSQGQLPPRELPSRAGRQPAGSPHLWNR